jgi:hypothetical protein
MKRRDFHKTALATAIATTAVGSAPIRGSNHDSSYRRATPNLDDTIRHGKLRKTIDIKVVDIHNDLSQAYYDFWRQGISHPITYGPTTFDVQPTPAETLDYWNNLQAAMTHFYTVYFHQRNMEVPPPIKVDESKYRYQYVDTDVEPPVVERDLVADAAIQCRHLRDDHGIDFSGPDMYDIDIDAI